MSGEAADAFVGKFDDAAGTSEQRVVFALHDVLSGADGRAALAHENIAGLGIFAGVLFHAQALTLGIAAVTGRTAGFFGCHIKLVEWRM